jgi:mannan endo-1,4-beta-mannosidase
MDSNRPLGAWMHRRVSTLKAAAGTAIALALAAGLLTGAARSTPAGGATPWVLGKSGTSLTLNGVKHQFVGVDAYEIATEWGTNAGCGADETNSQLNHFFASLPPNSLVRIWAFQGSMATNVTTGQLDWQPLDRVFRAAADHDQHLIVVLGGQGEACDSPSWQDLAWYQGGFRDVQDFQTSTGVDLTPLSYWRYMQAIVRHFRNYPALAMWEPMSEAEASTCPPQFEPSNCSGNQTCPNEHAAAVALRHFFGAVGREIQRLDPSHLVESGLLGGGQCGTSYKDFQYVNESPGINVVSIHVYCVPMRTMCGNKSNGEALRFTQTAALHKPLIIGEEGMAAGAGIRGCPSFRRRAAVISDKARAEFKRGSAAILLWDWEPSEQGACTYNITSNDPTFRDLAPLARSVDTSN